MDIKHNTPVAVVDNKVMNLRHLASLCNIMMFVDSSSCEVEADTVSYVMTYLWECLNTQIDALNGIVSHFIYGKW